ncbi:cytochrome b5 domain-containing protein [Enterococcus faecalis]|uniref:cytochrome b5 domain-containing protein n=1 Tax=Enterococcus faecalis TaxID=1351 RepID=UPI0030C7FB50
MEKIFTKEELKQYDGKNNQKKYVAIDGIVYDLTSMKAWKGENHHGNHAGQDLSAMIIQAPHKTKVLEKLEVVGKYVE